MISKCSMAIAGEPFSVMLLVMSCDKVDLN
jgi:hypothetical protein